MDHKIDNKYQELLKIAVLNTEHNTVYIPRKTAIGKLQPVDVADLKIINISWTTDDTVSKTNKPTELRCLPPKSSFQLEYSNNKHSVVLENAHIPQETRDG